MTSPGYLSSITLNPSLARTDYTLRHPLDDPHTSNHTQLPALPSTQLSQYAPNLQPYTSAQVNLPPTYPGILHTFNCTHMPTLTAEYLTHLVTMASQSIVKQPVALSLADLEKYPTLTDRYAATLPFRYKAIDCECFGKPDYWEYESCWDLNPPTWFFALKAKLHQAD